MRVTVRVPATSANLGPGFDCFGLAWELCNELVVDTGAPPGATWDGEGADELPTDGSDLIGRVMSAVAGRLSLSLAQLTRRGRNLIPLERGLGSSAAATVAGVVAASALLDLGIDADPISVFALAAEIEGHPDNVAAAVFGGFTIALVDGSVQRLEPHPDLRPALLVPDLRMPTPAARGVLPESVPRADAVANVGRAAVEVHALTRDPSLLSRSLVDRLHEDVRLASMPEVADVGGGGPPPPPPPTSRCASRGLVRRSWCSSDRTDPRSRSRRWASVRRGGSCAPGSADGGSRSRSAATECLSRRTAGGRVGRVTAWSRSPTSRTRTSDPRTSCPT
jgi:homoserine kinase